MSSFRYLIVCCTVLMVTCMYAWSLYDRLFQIKLTHEPEWSWTSLSWSTKDIDNLNIVLALVKDDLHTIYFVLLQALIFLEPWKTTLVISGVFLTFAVICKYFFFEATNMPRTYIYDLIHLYSFVSKLSFKKIVSFIVIITTLSLLACFLASLPIEYYRLYKTEQSKKMAVLGRGVPIECRSAEELTFIESVRITVSSLILWQHDPCEKYHTALSVEPLLEITPLMVIPSVIARSVFHPIELFFGMMGRSLKLFFNEIPGLWQLCVWISGFALVLSLTIVFVFRNLMKLPRNQNIEPNTTARNTPIQTACNICKESGHTMIDCQKHFQEKDENKRQLEQNDNESSDDIVQDGRVKLPISKTPTISTTSKTSENRKSGSKKHAYKPGQQRTSMGEGGNIVKKQPSSNKFVTILHRRTVNAGDRTHSKPTKALHKEAVGIDDRTPSTLTEALHKKTAGSNDRTPAKPTKALRQKIAGIGYRTPSTPTEALHKKTAGIDDRTPSTPTVALHKKTAEIDDRTPSTPTESLHKKTAGIDDRTPSTPTESVHKNTAGIDDRTLSTPTEAHQTTAGSNGTKKTTKV